MVISAVFFDLGGVILRTEHQAPREHLAERLGLSYEELIRLVFESESAHEASIGRLTAAQHWEAIARRLGQQPTEIPELRDEFFGGDVLDRSLLNFIRSLRPARKTALVSNAWLDLRTYIQKHRFEDAFDAMVISAEVGILKPAAEIYGLALDAVGARPTQAVMVDDTPENIRAAEALGMQGVLFQEPQRARAQLAKLLA